MEIISRLVLVGTRFKQLHRKAGGIGRYIGTRIKRLMGQVKATCLFYGDR